MVIPAAAGELASVACEDIPAVFDATRGHRARVEAFAAWVGLAVRWDLVLLPSGHAYRGATIAALCDALRPWMALHDVAHYLLAPRWRRRRTNFGLGPAPQVRGREAPTRPLVSLRRAGPEEECAAVLTVLLAWALLDGDSAASATLGHVAMHGYDPDDNDFTDARYDAPLERLRARGLIAEDNRVPLVERFRAERPERFLGSLFPPSAEVPARPEAPAGGAPTAPTPPGALA